jgi:hypothetical protein
MAALHSAYDSMVVGLCRSHARAIIVVAALGLVVLALQAGGGDVACTASPCGVDSAVLQSAVHSF